MTRIETITRQTVDQTGKSTNSTHSLSVTIVPGAITGTRVTFPQAGDHLHGQLPANVVFIIQEQPHNLFRRIRFDLEYLAKIKAADACGGAGRELQIPTIENELIPLVINEMITNSTVKIIPNRGLPICNGPIGKRGNLIVKFEIVYGMFLALLNVFN